MQIDLRVDISGLLSSHPSSPLISLHHFDAIDPIFPSKNRSESINHLMKPAKFDQSRLLQQTKCYHRQSNWTLSISWGYSAHIYQSIFPRSFLRRPLQRSGRGKRAGPRSSCSTLGGCLIILVKLLMYFSQNLLLRVIILDDTTLLLPTTLEVRPVTCRFVYQMAILRLIQSTRFKFFRHQQDAKRCFSTKPIQTM